MATFKAGVHKHRIKADNTFKVVIRLSHNRKSVYLSTPFYVGKDKLNNKYEIKDNWTLKAIAKIVEKYRDDILKIGNMLDRMSVTQVAEYLQKDNSKDIDFIDFSEALITKLKASGKLKTASTLSTTINNIKLYTKRNKLPVLNLNVSFLSGFEDWLRNKTVDGVKTQMSDTSINLYMRNIRSLYNDCMDKYNTEDDIRIPNYPFRTYHIPAAPITAKRNLELEIIRKIQAFKGDKYRELDEQGRDVFMLSFFLVGMNTVDIYSCPKPVNGRITYNRTKTEGRRKDRAEISIKVEPELEFYLKKYKGKDHAFNFSEKYSSPSDFNKYVNQGLNRIGDEMKLPSSLSSYAARHSWASIARNDCRIPKDDVHTALNHSDPSMKTTDIYIAKDWSVIDRANRTVIDKLLQKDKI